MQAHPLLPALVLVVATRVSIQSYRLKPHMSYTEQEALAAAVDPWVQVEVVARMARFMMDKVGLQVMALVAAVVVTI